MSYRIPECLAQPFGNEKDNLSHLRYQPYILWESDFFCSMSLNVRFWREACGKISRLNEQAAIRLRRFSGGFHSLSKVFQFREHGLWVIKVTLDNFDRR